MLLLQSVGVSGDLAKKLEAEIIAALANARDAVFSGGATAPMQIWFGITDPTAAKPLLTRALAFMRSHINNTPISFSLSGDTNPKNNADAIPINLKGGSTYAKYWDLMSQNRKVKVKPGLDTSIAESVIRLGMNFKNLQIYGDSPLSNFDGQDKFETLVHELSHVILGTDDEMISGSRPAYGAVDARLLAVNAPNKAFNNAENWGFFVEEFRA
jgi:hypothetical protein